MTGPPDPHHDDPEPLPVVLPIWKGEHGYSFSPSAGQSYEGPSVRVVLPHAWGLAIDPCHGVVVAHVVRTDLPSLVPSAVVGAAKQGLYGFKILDVRKEKIRDSRRHEAGRVRAVGRASKADPAGQRE